MRLDTSGHMRLEHRLKLAPRMIQSMEILQLPTLALEERIDQELAENPVLERLDAAGDSPSDGLAVAGLPAQATAPSTPAAAGASGSDGPPSPESPPDFHGESWLGNGSPHRLRGGDADAKSQALANIAAPGASLQEQLLGQWSLLDLNPTIRRAGEVLMDWMDADGYIRDSLDIISRELPPGVRRQDLQAAWPILQERLEPAGLGARNLRECLLLQLDALARQKQLDVRVPRLLVDKHLEDLRMNRLPNIARQHGLTLEQIKNAHTFIAKHLNPRPAAPLTARPTPGIIPDAIIELDESTGRYNIRLTDDRLPRLCINEVYERMAHSGTVDSTVRKFLGDNIRQAHWLLDAIAQRRSTLLRVLRVVAEAQKDFIEYGPERLQPLPMTAVADQLGVHVATISRAAAGKYVQTPRGILPLRRFFSGGVADSGGGEVSWEAIKARLWEVIQKEDRKHPLRDDEIAAKLAQEGIKLARRTVAKYRKVCQIPPARRRREF